MSLKWCDETSSLARTQRRRRRRSGHDTENIALLMAYTQTNERADPEKYAIENVRKEKTLRSRTVAVFLETTHSLPAIETAIILK